MSLSTKVPTCLVIHDLAFEHYPEHFVLAHRLYWRHYIPLFAKKATWIATVSTFSKEDIVKHYGIDRGHIDVVYNGIHDEYRPLTVAEREEVKNKYAEGCEYFVFAGALHPRKNIVNLLKAFIAFRIKQPTDMKLVIAGRPAWKYDEVGQLRAEMEFKDEVKWLGYMDVDELSRVTGGAYALVYASLFEGFGVPIVEAQQCDVPAIVSNTSSMPEVAGNAALMVNPNDVQDIADKMHQLYEDEALRTRLIANARIQRQKFSWELSAQKLWDCMIKCVT